VNALAIETSTRTAKVACICDSSLLIERVLKQGQPSAGLLRLIDSTLNECGKTITDIDLFVVNTGPGSFTGLATVLAFTDVLSKPVIGVNSFEVFASSVASDLPVVVWIDTRQGDVYHAILKRKGDGMEYLSSPKTGEPEELLKEIKKVGKDIIFAGDGSVKFHDLIVSYLNEGAIFSGCSLLIPSAGILGVIGLKKFKEKGVSQALPSPFYLRDFSVDKKLT